MLKPDFLSKILEWINRVLGVIQLMWNCFGEPGIPLCSINQTKTISFRDINLIFTKYVGTSERGRDQLVTHSELEPLPLRTISMYKILSLNSG